MKILLLISVLLILFSEASVQDSINKKEFQISKNLNIDNIVDLMWERNIQKLKYKKAKKYCSNLNSNSKSDWRLPTLAELKYIRKYHHLSLKSLMSFIYIWASDKRSKYISVFKWKNSQMSGDSIFNTRACICIRGKKYSNFEELDGLMLQKFKLKSNDIYQKAIIKNTIKEYNLILKIYPDLFEVDYIKIKLYKLYKIEFEHVKKIHTIQAYNNFISKYPKSLEVTKAKKEIYKIEFEHVKKIHTIQAYNNFIFKYPYSNQVSLANQEAYSLEKRKYTEEHIFDFFNKKETREKNARKLLIRAKIILISSKKSNTKKGYYIVVHRMYKLLKIEFDDTETTLHLLESQL